MKNKYLPDSIVNPLLNESFFIYQFYKSSQKLRENFNQAISQFGIISVQFAILYVIENEIQAGQKSVGKDLGIDKASMVKFLTGLENLGYISRQEDENDRRNKLISLTLKGKKVIKKIDLIRRQIESNYLKAHLAPNEVEIMYQLVKKLSQA